MAKKSGYPLAHIRRTSEGEWVEHTLTDHLEGVAALGAEFAGAFGAAEFGRVLGLWHDLGKFQPEWQEYLISKSGAYNPEATREDEGGHAKVPHAAAGAYVAIQKDPWLGKLLAYCIAGHHTGLPDGSGDATSLDIRLKSGQREWEAAQREAVKQIGEDPPLPHLPIFNSEFAYMLWTRLLFSCLVDADFLDTERFMNPEQFAHREGTRSIWSLKTALDEFMVRLTAQSKTGPVNEARREILDLCLEAAKGAPGIYSLTVPTGGGKTLSSLAFALEHAARHDHRRVIYAIPYTSIIEQTADVFRLALGKDAVLEHHSNLGDNPRTEQQKLAAENWDAPLIVTTNVQLFESLFAARTARCRKVHRVAGSVIVLDEVQMLPRPLLAPVTKLLETLAKDFKCTILLTTATQPGMKPKEMFKGHEKIKIGGLSNVKEIIPDPTELAKRLRRVQIKALGQWGETTSFETLADLLASEETVLAIVNARAEARRLYELLKPLEGTTLHLSALMCGQHRSDVITEIKQSLEARRHGESVEPLRVVSTQLVEAGVDLDFPVVYRALAGLDSIAQAAGRCNREGRMAELGRVVVFKSEKAPPPGSIKQGSQIAAELMSLPGTDPIAPDTILRYFDRYYEAGTLDQHDILGTLERGFKTRDIAYRTWAKQFRFINEDQESIVVPYVPKGYKESPVYEWLKKLEGDPTQRWVYRALQRYTVTVRKKEFEALERHRMTEPRANLYLLSKGFYSPAYGLTLAVSDLAPSDLVG